MELKFRLPLRVFSFKKSTAGAFGGPLAVLSSEINHMRYVLIKIGRSVKIKPRPVNRILMPLRLLLQIPMNTPVHFIWESDGKNKTGKMGKMSRPKERLGCQLRRFSY